MRLFDAFVNVDYNEFMNVDKAAVKNKIMDLEAEIGLLKKAVNSRPNFDVDEANWKKIRPAAKKIRNKVYKKVYD